MLKGERLGVVEGEGSDEAGEGKGNREVTSKFVSGCVYDYFVLISCMSCYSICVEQLWSSSSPISLLMICAAKFQFPRSQLCSAPLPLLLRVPGPEGVIPNFFGSWAHRWPESRARQRGASLRRKVTANSGTGDCVRLTVAPTATLNSAEGKRSAGQAQED